MPKAIWNNAVVAETGVFETLALSTSAPRGMCLSVSQKLFWFSKSLPLDMASPSATIVANKRDAHEENAMLIGYARISTTDQTLALQEDALRVAGCAEVFHDVASGVADARPGLAEALAFLRDGDTLVVWKLDRLGRSLRHLIDTVNALSARGVGLRSLGEALDTSTPGGKLVFHVFGALAEFERELIVERTQAGLKAARARGRLGGRPPLLSGKKLEMARSLMTSPDNSIAEVCRTLAVSRATLYRAIGKGEAKRLLEGVRPGLGSASPKTTCAQPGMAE